MRKEICSSPRLSKLRWKVVTFNKISVKSWVLLNCCTFPIHTNQPVSRSFPCSPAICTFSHLSPILSHFPSTPTPFQLQFRLVPTHSRLQSSFPLSSALLTFHIHLCIFIPLLFFRLFLFFRMLNSDESSCDGTVKMKKGGEF